MSSAAGNPTISALLLLCARPCGDDSARAQIAEIAKTGADWPGLLAAAADHGLAPLVCERLNAADAGASAPLWRGQFREEFARMARRNLILTAELFRILAALEVRGVYAVPYKGPTLAALAYGDIALRQFADLDIVVPQREIAEACHEMSRLGYRCDLEPSQARDLRFIARGDVGQLSFSRAGALSTIELHTEKTLRYFPARLDWQDLRSRIQNFRFGGGSARAFSPEDTLCLLSVHGAKHLWERLVWICDLSNLAQLRPSLNWTLAEQIARRLHCWRMVLLGLALGKRLLDTPLPEHVLGAIKRDSRVLAMRSHICGELFRQPARHPGVPRRLLFRLQSHDTLLDGLRQCLQLATQPTEDDWQAVHLPRRLEPLYGLLRPLRLMRKHGLA